MARTSLLAHVLSALAALTLRAAPGAAPDDSASKPPETKAPAPSFTVECQMVTVHGKLIPTLVPELNEDTTAAAAYAKLQNMIAKGEATLTAHLSVRGSAGQKLVTESLKEVRYPTEFDSPELPATTPAEPSLEVLKNWPFIGITPRSFDTRNIGQMLEIEVDRTSDPKIADCSYVVQHIRLEKMEKYDAGRLANGEHIFVEQPFFSTMKDLANSTFEVGQPRLIGVHRLPRDESMFELFLLTIRYSSVKAR